MGRYVHLSVIFAGGEPEDVQPLAQQHADQLNDSSSDPDALRDVRAYLMALASGRPHNCGPKGEVWAWGYVGNHTGPEVFVRILRPFWRDLLSTDEGGHIIVFYEPEQRERAGAYEIGLRSQWGHPPIGEDALSTADLIIRHHANLPFAWMQF